MINWISNLRLQRCRACLDSVFGQKEENSQTNAAKINQITCGWKKKKYWRSLLQTVSSASLYVSLSASPCHPLPPFLPPSLNLSPICCSSHQDHDFCGAVPDPELGLTGSEHRYSCGERKDLNSKMPSMRVSIHTKSFSDMVKTLKGALCKNWVPLIHTTNKIVGVYHRS